MDVDAVFEETELFKAFGLFEDAWRQSWEALERGSAVGVEADVFPVLRCRVVAIVRDSGAGEVEGSAVGRDDYFDGVWVGYVLGSAENFEGRDFYVRLCEGAQE